jgi:hypothetical protein
MVISAIIDARQSETNAAMTENERARAVEDRAMKIFLV